ncbi:alanine--tRNA ligase [Halothermothrix orenii]|uniref:Alanine--tRNA ligase n=1 Tax=Halothermothrix orenii (strain H 168 / OCM 544 / DSM 9562) TaxID=373903 RepID=B8D2A5_HALOH|nr:alanine--tRNA ligase [Halothermothrix orenii]ACL69332.1 alanyl-tRNA synthetase [Halothermothrix orenii H 168]
MVTTSDELRKAYLDFFKDRGHLVLPSAPLIPRNDPSLLWINAGMAPFKPYFDGRKKPPKTRISTSQKCIRTNDIENVGKTARHLTFFEMLGNFSFGDYFKEEAIEWAWEFVTRVLNLEENRLWITIYKDDDEAFKIWHDKVGVPENRIVRMGKKDNFWEIGTGPCGPCSEIHYDRGEEFGNSSEDVIGGEGDRFLEIWNLVFTQYNRTEDGEYLSLPQKNIDTGMGLERVASLLQGVNSNFETDLLKPIINFVSQDSGVQYTEGQRVPFRVISDHIRAVTMAIHDGVLPSNEGRGYVIRRLLRRAVRYGGKLNYEEPFLYKIVPVVVDIMSGGYPELKEKEEHVSSVVKSEEERFFQTLEQGLNILNEMMEEMKDKGEKILSGKNAFKLYDTYGFPLDLTRDVLAEHGYKVDEDVFTREMEKQRERARQARADVGFSGTDGEGIYKELREELGETEFTGYRSLSNTTRIVGIVKDGQPVESLNNGEKGEIILNVTPFYARGGGQVGDKGILIDSEHRARVYDTRKKGGLTVHYTEVEKGEFRIDQVVEARVDEELRYNIARNHSTTHLLHKTLKEVLGDHVNQSGSLVAPDRLRFDFSHYAPLTEEEINRIEDTVNEKILSNLPVEILEMPFEKAKEMGAVALFGEKYGHIVRVVKIGDYSIELCGGTHVDRTGEIGSFKIVSEGSVAAGVRRIEALTGKSVLEHIRKNDNTIKKISSILKTSPDEVIGRLSGLLEEQNELENKLQSLKDQLATSRVDELVDEVQKINGVKVLTAELKGIESDNLRKLSDKLKEKMESGIIVLASNLGNKVIFVSVVTDDLVERGFHAGKLIGKVARVTGGGGGGRPDMAQAGGKKVDKITEALDEGKRIISNHQS